MISPEILRHFTLFAGLSHLTLKHLAMLGEEITLNKGEWLFAEGDDAESLYFIISGSIDLKIKLDADGLEYEDVSTLIGGELVGWSALVEPYAYRLGAIAADDVRLVQLDAVDLRELMTDNPTTGFQIMQRLTQIMGKRLSDMRLRLVSLAESG